MYIKHHMILVYPFMWFCMLCAFIHIQCLHQLLQESYSLWTVNIENKWQTPFKVSKVCGKKIYLACSIITYCYWSNLQILWANADLWILIRILIQCKMFYLRLRILHTNVLGIGWVMNINYSCLQSGILNPSFWV